MTLKRKISILVYSLSALLCIFLLLTKLKEVRLFSNSSFGLPYWLVYMFAYSIPILLFVLQAIRFDKLSSRLITILTLLLLIITLKGDYDFYYERNFLPNAKGPVPYPSFLNFVTNYGPLIGGVILSLILYPSTRAVLKENDS